MYLCWFSCVQDMLVLFAAGNEGKDASVSSQGLSKNVVTVGASQVCIFHVVRNDCIPYCEVE
mgnify:CR=1 FL=1